MAPLLGTIERTWISWDTNWEWIIHMFYVNMHTISPDLSFWMTMFGQSFHITFLSVRCVLSLLILHVCLLSFIPEVQSLTLGELLLLLTLLYDAPHELPTYISLDYCYFPFIFFLSLVLSYRDSSIDCLFHPRHPIWTTVQYWSSHHWHHHPLPRLFLSSCRTSF